MQNPRQVYERALLSPEWIHVKWLLSIHFTECYCLSVHSVGAYRVPGANLCINTSHASAMFAHTRQTLILLESLSLLVWFANFRTWTLCWFSFFMFYIHIGFWLNGHIDHPSHCLYLQFSFLNVCWLIPFSCWCPSNVIIVFIEAFPC